MDKKQIETETKILIVSILIFIMFIVLFRMVFNSYYLVNNEISFRNYLDEKRLIENPLIFSNNNSIIINNNLPEKIVYPKYIFWLFAITLILILRNSDYIINLYLKRKALIKQQEKDLNK